MALYLIVAIRMMLSPISDARRTVKFHNTRIDLSASSLITYSVLLSVAMLNRIFLVIRKKVILTV